MRRSGLRVTAAPRGLFVIEAGPTVGKFEIANTTGHTVNVRPKLSVPGGFRAELMRSKVHIPAHRTVRVPVKVWRDDTAMPRGTLTLHAEDAFDWKSVIGDDDWVRIAAMSASSSHASAYLGWKPIQAANGFTFQEWGWGPIMGWNDGSRREFPDWLQATWETPVRISMVRVRTRDDASRPAAGYGLRDYDVEIQAGGRWQRVDEVRGNTEGIIESRFPPVETRAIRLMIWASNDGVYSRVVELEAYGPDGRPTPDLHKRYGGPASIYPAG